MSLPTAGAATAAAIGKGTTFGYSTTTVSPTYVVVAELLDLKTPQNTAEPIAIQRYDSPTFFEELIAGWAKGGECSVSLTYNAAQGAALYALFNVLAAYQITKPDAKTASYVGIMTDFGDEVPLKDKMMNVFKFKVSGPPVYASTSA